MRQLIDALKHRRERRVLGHPAVQAALGNQEVWHQLCEFEYRLGRNVPPPFASRLAWADLNPIPTDRADMRGEEETNG